jgi:UDP-N-acetylglucosamine 2-epimerase (non-hydrolysing)
MSAKPAKKFLVVFGTRPEAIKLAPLIALKGRFTGQLDFKVCVTAQHRQMLDQVLNAFDISPDYDMGVMLSDQSVNGVVARVLEKLPPILSSEKPDIVIVQGDTATAFAAALAAFNLKIPVAHVEAGLRTYDLNAPFPEEALRQMLSRITRYQFAPTARSRDNLLREGIDQATIHVTGNTVIDALLLTRNKLLNLKDLKELAPSWQHAAPAVLGKNRLVLITGHRRENFGAGIAGVCQAIKELAVQNADVDFVYPIHPNPNVLQPVKESLGGIENVFLISPVDYVPFVYLMERSHFIISDSGGMQEEAPSLGKPVLVTRTVTERTEALDCGVVKLVGTDPCVIVREARRLLSDPDAYRSMTVKENPYGDGRAAKRIMEVLARHGS